MGSMKLASIERERKRREHDDRESISTWLRHHAREMSREEIDGFALVVWRHDDANTVSTRTRYRVRHVLDKFAMPEMVRTKLQRAIDSDYTFVEDKDAPA